MEYSSNLPESESYAQKYNKYDQEHFDRININQK